MNEYRLIWLCCTDSTKVSPSDGAPSNVAWSDGDASDGAAGGSGGASHGGGADLSDFFGWRRQQDRYDRNDFEFAWSEDGFVWLMQFNDTKQ